MDARDRIGEGPWANANGLVMATSVDNLHFDNSNFNLTFMLDENGNQFASRIDGDPDFTEHDVLTGTRIDGTAFTDGSDMTCSNWTSTTKAAPVLVTRIALLHPDLRGTHLGPYAGKSGCGGWRRVVLLLCDRLKFCD